MEIEIKAEELRNVLKIVSVAVHPKISISKFVLINADEQVKITSTDLELSITATAKAEINKKGIVCVDYQQLLNIANVSKKDLLLFDRQNILSVKSINSSYELPTINSDDYPKIPNISEVSLSELSLPALKNALMKVSSAVGQDDSRYVFTCISINEDKIIATNGFRLSIAEVQTNISALVKDKFIKVIKQLNNDTIHIGDSNNRIALKSDMLEVSISKINGNFPDYRQVLVDYQHNMECNRLELIDAIKSVCIDTDPNSQSIYMQATDNRLLISKQSKEQGTKANTTISCNSSKDFKVYLSYKSMLDILNVLDGDTALIKFPDAEDRAIEKAILIEDNNSKHILMPYREG